MTSSDSKPATSDSSTSGESQREEDRDDDLRASSYELGWLRKALFDIDRAVQAGNSSAAKALLERVQRVLESRNGPGRSGH
jgi:hypothetical protein